MTDKPQLVSDLMTRDVVTLFEEENLEQLQEGMERFGFRHLPVVDGKKLVGLVTHRDLLRAAVSILDPAGRAREQAFEQGVFVAQIMTRNPATVRPDTPLAEAARTMRQGKFGCLPVTDEDNDLVGIITEADFVDLALRLLEA